MLPAVRVENLGKSYRLGVTHAGSLRELANRAASPLLKIAGRGFKAPRKSARDNCGGEELFWALRNASFDVLPGSVVGVIGRNGAGKSTLLKILSRITYPTEGKVEIHGRVASLLEVGTGFHPELTGRENVFLNGTLLGMTKREVERCFDEIVSFAEVENFIDTPVKRYSSGMTVRLAFAVAAHLQPEILFVDEVLAVGDAAFQEKCLTKMSDLGHAGRTILFVSHNMAAIRELTRECIVIEGGRVSFIGPSDQAVDRYLERQRHTTGTSSDVLDLPRVRWCGDRSVEFANVKLLSPANQKLSVGQRLEMEITVRAKEDVNNFGFVVTLYTGSGSPLATAFGEPAGSILAGDWRTFQLTLPDAGLAPGSYWLSLAVVRSSRILVDAIHDVLHFEVTPDGRIPSGFSEWLSVWGDLRLPLTCEPSQLAVAPLATAASHVSST